MHDSIRRAIRTFAQTFLGLYLIKVVGFLNALAEWAGCKEAGAATCAFPDVGALGYAFVAAVSAAVVALIAWAQNALEDRGTIPALLKAPASSGVDPVPPDGDVPLT